MLADADESSELTDRISFDLERSGNQVARATSPQGLGCLSALQGAERLTQRYSGLWSPGHRRRLGAS